MKSLWWGVVALLISVPVLAGLGAPHHRETQSALRPADLMSRARQREDLRAAGGEPFRLTGSIRVISPGQRQVSGTYTLLWLSPRKWREEISLPGFTQVSLLVGDTLWLDRTPAKIPSYGAFELQQSPDFRSLLMLKSGQTFSRVKARKKHGIREDCFAVQTDKRSRSNLCFDADSGVLLSAGNKVGGTRFSDFASWGGKVYPRTITIRNADRQVAEIQAMEISKLAAPPAGSFVPPPGATSMRGCQDPLPPKLLKGMIPRYPSLAIQMRLTGTVHVFATIGVDGRIDDAYVLSSPDKIFDRPVLNTVSNWMYRPATCGGVPVPYEAEIDTDFDILQ